MGYDKVYISNDEETVNTSKNLSQILREQMKARGQRFWAGDNISDQDLLREIMNTVGKEGQLGASIRCVVSVSMLTEGWDAQTVTHVLGVRAFGTQLLCEQVIGRALRRQSYELNDEGLFDVEYADVLGIPFDFTAKPVVAPPQPPRETVQVQAIMPERDGCEITFPRVGGYRVVLPEDRLVADFNDDSTLILTPDLVGPTLTRSQGIIGTGADLHLEHLEDTRQSTLVFELTNRLVTTKLRDAGGIPMVSQFGNARPIVRRWLNDHLVCKGGTYPAQLIYQELADMACERIYQGIVKELYGEKSIKAVLDPYNPTGSSRFVNFTTSRKLRWETAADRCQLNWAICDSEWEVELCRVLESHPRVRSYVRNQNLGFEVPYRSASTQRRYLPDFIVNVDDGHGDEDLLHLIIEVKGFRGEDAKDKKNTMDAFWIPGVNNLGGFGRWAFAEFTDVYTMGDELDEKITESIDAAIDEAIATDQAASAPATS